MTTILYHTYRQKTPRLDKTCSFRISFHSHGAALAQEEIMGRGILLCLASALGFGMWPLVARYSAAPPAWVTIVITATTMCVAGGSRLTNLPPVPTPRILGLLVTAGIANGIGMIAYGKLVASGYSMSGLIPLVVVAMTAIIATGGVLWFGESMTWQKSAGIICAMLAAWLLK